MTITSLALWICLSNHVFSVFSTINIYYNKRREIIYINKDRVTYKWLINFYSVIIILSYMVIKMTGIRNYEEKWN